MRRLRKQNIFLLLILLLAGLGIGYAYLTTTLTINGTTDVDSNTWNVHWENIHVTTGSVTGSQVTQAPTIIDNTTVSFHIRLKEPGEFYEFTVDVKNDGSIDAMIEQIIKTINGNTTIPAYLDYTVTYDDDVPILENQLLAAGTKETYKIRLEYKTDLNPGDLPNNLETLNVRFATPHIQSSKNPVPVRTYVYAFNTTRTYIGDNVSKLGTTYESPEDLYSGEQKTYFTRHVIRNGKVAKSDLGFTINKSKTTTPDYHTYYIDNIGEAEKYAQNQQYLTNIFGSASCETVTPSGAGAFSYYNCIWNETGVGKITGVVIYDNYLIRVVGFYECDLYPDGSTRCDYE